nr:B3 domain-containing transcription repressor VAL1-like [Ipomoea batatas]
MGSKFCMNELCRATTSSEWKKGWGLKSGGFATLCSNCGYLYDYMDFGGIGCMSCARRLGGHALRPIQTPNDDIPNGTLTMNKIGDTQRADTENRMDENDFDKGRLLHLSRTMEAHKPGQLFQSQNNGKIKQEAAVPIREVACLPNLNQQSVETSIFGKTDINIPKQGVKDTYESINQTPMNFSLSTPVGTSSSALHILAGIVEGREQNKVSPFQQGQKAHHILPKPVKAAHSSGSEPKKGMTTPNRIARPPGEGRGGRNQLLPRYWPRITDQELQKLSGDLKSNIVPLFEKVLSASDAGRIGRLVLPKACAEAYFPAINHSEGIAIRVQDIKGQEWTFQFRFWPNNNSRMYVLEGVTPCIQSMQLQAGDTVTFSRIDPGGKLVMGFRKATNNADAQDSPNPTLPNGGSCTEIQVSGATDNDMKNEIKAIDDPLPRPVSIPEKKKTRNIGSKNKRLLMQAKDALELKITWEEAQDLLRPPPSAKPTIVVIEEFEFEEYEEPPVFGKRTIFTARPSGTNGLNVTVAPNGAGCLFMLSFHPSGHVWIIFGMQTDSKRRRITENGHDCEPSGLDALATVAVLGDNIGDLGEPSAGVGATTKHPRHRPGCSCIVCIQPPSGKGKHLPSCKCNVCLTVRRRFKTLMLRKKKKQSEREAELGGQGNEEPPRDGSEIEGASGLALIQMNHSENDSNPNGDNDPIEDAGTSKGQLDLNCDPNREEDMLALIPFDDPAANLPIETSRPVQTDLDTLRDCLLAQAAREDEGNRADDTQIASSDSKQENNRENGAQFLD